MKILDILFLFILFIMPTVKSEDSLERKLRELDAILLRIDSLEEKLSQLESLVKIQEPEIQDLRATNEKLMDRLSDLEKSDPRKISKGSFTRTKAEHNQSLSDEISNIETFPGNLLVHGIGKRSVTTAAFHTYMGNSNKCVRAQQLIVFDVEVLDIGNGYNVNDGIYEPPVSGVYVFTWTVVAPYQEYFTAELVVNGEIKGVTMTDAHSYGVSGIHPATGVVVIRVNAGDNIYIRRGTLTWGCSIVTTSWAMNTFSGWLLF